jgi:hypothetical protein
MRYFQAILYHNRGKIANVCLQKLKKFLPKLREERRKKGAGNVHKMGRNSLRFIHSALTTARGNGGIITPYSKEMDRTFS